MPLPSMGIQAPDTLGIHSAGCLSTEVAPICTIDGWIPAESSEVKCRLHSLTFFPHEFQPSQAIKISSAEVCFTQHDRYVVPIMVISGHSRETNRSFNR